MNLPALCVRRPVATAMLTLIAVVVGLFSMFRLPIDLLPELEIPTVSVRAEYGTASPEEMERLVTEYIEESISVVAGVDELTSTSGEGSTRVSAKFVWGTDVDEAANDVRTRIDRVIDELPDDLPRPRVSKYDINAFPIVILGISSPLDPVELTEMVEEDLLYRFERVAGVAQVDLWGESNREIRVELDLDRVRALGLPMDRILASIREANVNLPAGEIDRGGYEVTIRTPGEYASIDELASTVVAVRERGPVTLADIATIVDTHEEMTRLVRMKGRPSIRLAVRKQSDANTAEVAQGVLDVVDEIAAAYPQLEIIPISNQGTFIERLDRERGEQRDDGGRARGDRAARVPARPAEHDGDRGVDPDLGARDVRPHLRGRVHAQPDDARRAGARHRDDGRFVDRRAREHLPARERGERGRTHGVDPRDGRGRDGDRREHRDDPGDLPAAHLCARRDGADVPRVRARRGVQPHGLADRFADGCPGAEFDAAEGRRAREARDAAHRAAPPGGDRIFRGIDGTYAGMLRDALAARMVTIAAAVLLVVGAVLLIPRLGSEFMPPPTRARCGSPGRWRSGRSSTSWTPRPG